jgi:hypothetical protein
MDEDSIGFFGVLLIVTAMAMTHPFQLPQNMPTLPEMHWQEAAAVACKSDTVQDCSQATAR